MIRRLVTILISALLSVLAAAGLASGTTSVVVPHAVLAYTYSAPVYDAPGAHAKPARGPPARAYDDNSYDAAGRWSGGTSARAGGPASLAQTTYDNPSGFVQGAPLTELIDLVASAVPTKVVVGRSPSGPFPTLVVGQPGKGLGLTERMDDLAGADSTSGSYQSGYWLTAAASLLIGGEGLWAKIPTGVKALPALLKVGTKPKVIEGAALATAKLENLAAVEISAKPLVTLEATAANSGRTVAMGRNMADRVIPYAENNGYDWYKGTPGWVPRGAIEKVSSRALEKTDLWFNKRWINSEMRNGSKIMDIGEPPGYPPSISYNMERGQVSGYWNYFQDFQP